MEIYEIVKFVHKPVKGEEYFEPEVITATMDKELAEQMLSIYKSNQGENEAYHIRTLREPKAVPFNDEPQFYQHCQACNSYHRCLLTILEHPAEMIRCINFGRLKEYKIRRMNYE
jgi:hypothetical protein